MCEICGKSFKRSKDMKEHVSGVHEKKLAYKCKKCGIGYKYRQGLLQHRKKGKCPETPSLLRKLIYWGRGKPYPDTPICIHPDCVGKDLPKFDFNSIMNHVIDFH